MSQTEVISELRHQFGKRLKELRREQKLTQKQLSQITGVDRSRISHLESGDRTTSFDTVLLLSCGLGIAPAELLAGVAVPAASEPESPVILSLPPRPQTAYRYVEFDE